MGRNVFRSPDSRQEREESEAYLTTVHHPTPSQPPCSELDVLALRAPVDDHRRLATELEGRRRQMLGRRFRYNLSDLDTSCVPGKV